MSSRILMSPGLDMTLVGIQGWRSCLANGAPV